MRRWSDLHAHSHTHLLPRQHFKGYSYTSNSTIQWERSRREPGEKPTTPFSVRLRRGLAVKGNQKEPMAAGRLHEDFWKACGALGLPYSASPTVLVLYTPVPKHVACFIKSRGWCGWVAAYLPTWWSSAAFAFSWDGMDGTPCDRDGPFSLLCSDLPIFFFIWFCISLGVRTVIDVSMQVSTRLGVSHASAVLFFLYCGLGWMRAFSSVTRLANSAISAHG